MEQSTRGGISLVLAFCMTAVAWSADGPKPRPVGLQPSVVLERAPTPASSTMPAPAARPELTPPRRTAAILSGDAALVAALQSGAARPVGLASADFDRDGLADVAAFFSHGKQAVVVVHRANPDAYDPYIAQAVQGRGGASVEMTPAFLGDALVFAVPVAPDFFGTGDFDNDGHADVLVASKGASTFTVLPGDGSGAFIAPRRIALGGRLSALAVGNVNREDGIADVAAVVEAREGPRLRIYESPEGALRATPETIALPAVASALVIGDLQGDGNGDIVALAGRELLIVQGRDRHLGETVERAAAVGPASVERRRIDVEGRSLVLGRFTHEAVVDVVVTDAGGAVYRTPGHRAAALERLDARGATRGAVAARLSNARRDDLVLLGDASSAHLKTGSGFELGLDLAGAPAAALPMRLHNGAVEDLVLLDEGGRGQLTTTQLAPTAIFSVTSIANSGVGTLRQAILDANALVGFDQIQFSIPGAGPHIISITSPLPTIIGRVTIDARTQPGWAGTPLVFVHGAGSGAVCGLCFAGSGVDGSNVFGLGVRGFPGDGIRFDDVWSSVVDECYIGTDPTGTVGIPNINGVAVLRSQFNLIGGVKGNLISGNSNFGVDIQGGPSEPDTYGSIDVPKPIPDLSTTFSTLPMLLGAVVEDVNVTLDITHTYDADLVLTLISPTGLSVQLAAAVGGSGDNFTNTTFDDEAAAPIGAGTAPFTGPFKPASPLSAFDGGPVDGTWLLQVTDTAGLDVGTLNSWRLTFQHRTFGNQVQGNRIGTNAAGSLAVPNLRGVNVSNEASDLIGGTGAFDRNLISGNSDTGVWIEGTLSRGHRIEGNRVGTNAAGTTALGNGSYGIVMVSGPNGNTVGGTAAGAGNLVAAHPFYGIASQSVRDNRYQGNTVGTDLTGSVAIPNATAFAGFDVRGELIGGSAPGARNVFSGSTATGVYLSSFGGGGGNAVIGNFIGTNAIGSAALGNATGVALYDDGDSLNDNVISGNTANGIDIFSYGHGLSGNRIGVDAAATSPISNQNGVHISGGRSIAINGASSPNIIAGNLQDGVRIDGPPTLGPTTYVSSDVPKAILDLATVTSTLSVPADGVILDLDVRIDLVHTYDSDLSITLIDPFGVRIPLTQNRGSSGDNYAGTTFNDEAGVPIASGAPPFAGSFRPEQPLAYLDGRRLFDVWTLEIADQFGSDVGTLNSWQITVSYAQPLDNEVNGNFIGTNSLGSAGLKNGGHGVHLVNAARNIVGEFLFENTISGNSWGVLAEGASSSGNVIQHNYIGATAAQNSSGGVLVNGGLGNAISQNVLERNLGPGVFVSAGYNNTVVANSIQNNSGLGIDLDPISVNSNDPTDSDAGPNDLQNYPVITSLIPLGPNNQLDGTFGSEPNRTYRLDFYASATGDPSGHGEGASWQGNVLVNSGPAGVVPFTFVAPAGLGFYSVTATGPGGSTSEFSGAFGLPQEVPDTMLVSKAGSDLKVDYTPACGAADHAVFRGVSPIGGALSWTTAQCGFGASGQFSFNPGLPAPGTFFYFVVVGQTFSLEGSYGQNSSGAERPEVVGLFVCEQPQSLVGPCP